MLRHRKIKLCPAWSLLLACLAAAPAYGGTCISPAGNEADILYNSAFHSWQFCNGMVWMAYTGGGTCTPPANYTPTSPSGSGYFVMSGGTYNGNLGSLALADATCLTDLTTNTSWLGYATANANGQLIADKVHAFLCTGSACTNLMPLTTYYFANAGVGAAGGASFTTNSTGEGPNDSANWSGTTYFDGTYDWWSTRGAVSNTLWNNSFDGNNTECSNWTTSSSGSFGHFGNTANTTDARWFNISSSLACNNTENLICFVNP